MNVDEINKHKANGRPNEPFGTIAIVMRMPLKVMPDFVRMAEGFQDAAVIYQKTSAGKLMIVEER